MERLERIMKEDITLSTLANVLYSAYIPADISEDDETIVISLEQPPIILKIQSNNYISLLTAVLVKENVSLEAGYALANQINTTLYVGRATVRESDNLCRGIAIDWLLSFEDGIIVIHLIDVIRRLQKAVQAMRHLDEDDIVLD